MAQERTKNIVVFGANGGIGQAILNKLADAVEAGKPYRITVVSRKGEKFARGIIDEILDGRSTDESKQPADIAKRDMLEKAFNVEDEWQIAKNHPTLNPKDVSNLKDVIEKADVVISAGGLPRPNVPTGANVVERTDLIYPNSKVVIPIAQAMAKFAKPNTMLLIGTNPLDNMVQVADDTLHAEWIKAGRRGSLAPVNVIGMSSTLDEIRLQKYTARALNAALRHAIPATSIRINHSRDEVEGHIYGQHGPAMAIDFDGMKIKLRNNPGQPEIPEVSLDQFIAAYNLGNIKVSAINGKGEKKDGLTIKEAIQMNTTTAGTRQNLDIGRSAQTSTAKRMAELVDMYCSDTMHDSAACVNSAFLSDNRHIAYGRPIKIGDRKIELGEFPPHIKNPTVPPPEITANINKSRLAISKEQQVYTDCGKPEERILKALKGKCTITIDRTVKITLDEKTVLAGGVNIEVNDGVDRRIPMAVKGFLQKILGIAKITIDPTAPRTLDFQIEPKSMGALETLAAELGTTVKDKEQVISR